MSAARSRRANDKHNHLQRTPILVMGCSLLIACCIAFGGTNWTASAQPSEDQLPEQNAIVEPGYYQETIGSYEAISQSDDDERAENLRLAAEAINGYVIEPGATFSFNEVVGDTTAERGYKEAPVLYSSGLGSSDGGGICQVSTALVPIHPLCLSGIVAGMIALFALSIFKPHKKAQKAPQRA